MNIVIIGAGFYGCYIAKKLIEQNPKIKIDIYEKNSDILLGPGRYNQYRLHTGFHYPRSPETIEQTIFGEKIFRKEFKNFVYYPRTNLYAIHKNSLTNFKDYIKILNNFKLKYKIEKINDIDYFRNISDIEGVIKVKEGVIKIDKLLRRIKKKIFKLTNVKLNQEIIKVDSNSGVIVSKSGEVKKKYDFIINTTHISPNLGMSKDIFKIKYELTGIVICKNIFNKSIGITIMDGDHVSLYPMNNKVSSLTSVIHTPFKNFLNINEMKSYLRKHKINSIFKKKIATNIVRHAHKELNFNLKKLKTKDVSIAIKVKRLNDKGDTRKSSYLKKNKLISILCGKIDASTVIWQDIKKNFK